jgi:hypothetical protein
MIAAVVVCGGWQFANLEFSSDKEEGGDGEAGVL